MGNNSQRQSQYRNSNPLPNQQPPTIETDAFSERPSSCSFITCMPKGGISHSRVQSAQVMSLEKPTLYEECGSYIVPLKKRTTAMFKLSGRVQVPFNRLAFDRWLSSEIDRVPALDIENLWQQGSTQKLPDMAQEIYRQMLAQEQHQSMRNVLQAPIGISASRVDALDRQMVLKRLVEIWKKVQFGEEALHLAISYLDKMIEVYYSEMNVFQLRVVMVTGLLVAGKVDDKEGKGKLALILKQLTDEERTYITREIVLLTEETLLTQLNFELNLVTPYSFLERQLYLASVKPFDKILKKAKKLIILFRLNSSSIELKPSIIAASCLWKGALIVWKNDPIKSEQLKRDWLYRHQSHSGVSVSEITNTLPKLSQSIRESSNFHISKLRKITAKSFY